jgi:ribonuclease P protein component
LLSVGALVTRQPQVRVGLRTKRGLKGAVVRNRLKRQLRVVLSAQQGLFQPGSDVVIVLHPPRVPISTKALEKELRELCRRTNLLQPAAS